MQLKELLSEAYLPRICSLSTHSGLRSPHPTAVTTSISPLRPPVYWRTLSLFILKSLVSKILLGLRHSIQVLFKSCIPTTSSLESA